MKKIRAFTLVELIVVITILAILATIGYISLIGYSVTARDTSRISDLNSITKVIELYNIQEGVYPPVTNTVNITFSGATIWQQGSFGDDTRRFTERISEVPRDPLTGDEFAYSKTQATGEYQVGVIVEKSESIDSLFSGFVSQSYAAEVLLKPFATTLIKGNYNGKFITYYDESQLYFIAAPSILANEITSVSVNDIHNNASFVYPGGGTPPATFSGSVDISSPWNFSPTNTIGDIALIYTGSTSELSSVSGKIDFISHIKDYYAGTDVVLSHNFKELSTLDPVSNPNDVLDIMNTYIQTNVGGIGNGEISLSETLIGWRALDPNCPVEDIIIGNQTWAGCNSTLGDGVEWGKKSDGSDGIVSTCEDYDLNSIPDDPDCVIGNPLMASSSNPKDYFDGKQPDGTNANGDAEYDTIWGKFYTWDQAMGNMGYTGACPTGWHVPTLAEWTDAQNTLNGAICRTGDGWQCSGLGWLNHNTKTNSNSLANALKIPLAGRRTDDGETFVARGRITDLWMSTFGITDAYRIYLYYGIDTVLSGENNRPGRGMSVRCIKD